MQTIALTSSNGAAYTAQQVTDRLNMHGGSRQVSWRVELLNADKSVKGDLTPYVTTFTVTNDVDQPIHRTLTMDMAETAASQSVTVQGGVVTSAGIAYSTDMVRPWMRLWMPDGGFVEWALGTFKFKRPGATAPGYAIVRHAEMSDLTYLVSENEAVSSATGIPLYLPAGAYVLDVVRQMLTNAVGDPTLPGCGIQPTWLATDWPTTAQITAQVAPGYTLAEGTSYLDEINKLLQYVKCYPLWVDERGLFKITPWPPNQNYTVLTPSYTYDSQTDCIILPGVAEEFQLDAIKNVVQVVVEDASRTPFYAVAKNNDPASPYSVAAIGPFVDVIHASGIPNSTDQNWAQAYANQMLMFHAFLTDRVTMETAVNPAHQTHDVLALNIYQRYVAAGSAQNVPFIVSEKLPGLVVSERFLETAWTIRAVLPTLTGAKGLAGAGGVTSDLGARNQKSGHTMSHTLMRVTSVFNLGAGGSNIGTS